MIEKQLEVPNKYLQTDGGKEYVAFSQYLNTHGIIHRISCPYTHEQNGSTERKHRHITEVGLTLLANATMRLCYWGEAFQTIVYLIDRLPTPILNNITPLEKLFHTQPTYNDLRVFGFACYPYLRPYNKHKIQFRLTHYVFLGYSNKKVTSIYLLMVELILLDMLNLMNVSFLFNKILIFLALPLYHLLLSLLVHVCLLFMLSLVVIGLLLWPLMLTLNYPHHLYTTLLLRVANGWI